MDMAQTMEFLRNINTWFVANIDFPAVVLIIILLMGAWVLRQTQKNQANNFDFSDMLRDDNGKPSAFRMGIFVCMALSSWGIMYILINNKGKVDTVMAYIFLGYMAIWSGAKIVEKAIDAWQNKGQPIMTTSTTQSTDGQGNQVLQQVAQSIPVVMQPPAPPAPPPIPQPVIPVNAADTAIPPAEENPPKQ